jgi:hypothetical protein
LYGATRRLRHPPTPTRQRFIFPRSASTCAFSRRRAEQGARPAARALRARPAPQAPTAKARCREKAITRRPLLADRLSFGYVGLMRVRPARRCNRPPLCIASRRRGCGYSGAGGDARRAAAQAPLAHGTPRRVASRRAESIATISERNPSLELELAAWKWNDSFRSQLHVRAINIHGHAQWLAANIHGRAAPSAAPTTSCCRPATCGSYGSLALPAAGTKATGSTRVMSATSYCLAAGRASSAGNSGLSVA